MDRIQVLYGGSLGKSDDLISFWEEFIKNEMADGGHFEKNGHSKRLRARYPINRWLVEAHSNSMWLISGYF